ncbi:hypothetical protein GYMLUDRAFT_45614 [Collybiopsis luxurians FD-317 M1]|uniref:DUF6534 domain-containing protein n=1 Tax=Collybiopsis luxurians FD-317 M1 TaxID=944289 RepID=A0A0D0BS21_9AGAR|nr:hypothetical protein GYMLUDRAFT_45614 [Collybiopsis luxurians FD-317 M1]
MATLDRTVQENVGPMVIAVTINTFLYGLCFLQFIRYFTSASRDHFWTRLLVSWELLIDTCHSAVAVYMLWLYVVDNFTNEGFIVTAPWPVSSIAMFSAFSVTPIQIYLSYRVKKLSGNWIVFSILLALTITDGSLSVALAASALQTPTLAAMKRIASLIQSWPAFTAATDVAISASLIYYLRKGQIRSRQTDHIVSRLIREAIETASSASFFSIMLVVSYSLWPTTMISLVFAFPMARVYTNSFLAILNSRRGLRGDPSDTDLPPPHKTTLLNPHGSTPTQSSTSGSSQGQIQSGGATNTTQTRSAATTTTATNFASSVALTDFESLQPSFYSGGSVANPETTRDSMV